MFLIMSGAYVGQELESEFGRIPPSFLPLGNRRLFQHQVALAPQGVKVYLSLPESYVVSEIDLQWLEQNQVTIIATPDGLSLGASLVAALNISGHSLNAHCTSSTVIRYLTNCPLAMISSAFPRQKTAITGPY